MNDLYIEHRLHKDCRKYYEVCSDCWNEYHTCVDCDRELTDGQLVTGQCSDCVKNRRSFTLSKINYTGNPEYSRYE